LQVILLFHIFADEKNETNKEQATKKIEETIQQINRNIFSFMKQIIGYLLGITIFIIGIPVLMWWMSEMPSFMDIPLGRKCIASAFALAGLILSIWSVVYMKRTGKGNPFDAMGYEVAPRTKHLMTKGPYRFSRNPMLSGTYLYYIGIVVALWTWCALAILLVVVMLMMFQVRSEEKRLEEDFGEEYLEYKKRTGRFFTFK